MQPGSARHYIRYWRKAFSGRLWICLLVRTDFDDNDIWILKVDEKVFICYLRCTAAPPQLRPAVLRCRNSIRNGVRNHTCGIVHDGQPPGRAGEISG